MKYLILIVSLLIGNLNLSFAGVSYGTASELSHPVEKNVKKKQQRVKKRFFKKKRKPNSVNSKGKVVWLMVVGVIFSIIALGFLLVGIWFAIFGGFASTWFISVFAFFASIAIVSFILASIYSKNVGVRKTGRGPNEGKATY